MAAATLTPAFEALALKLQEVTSNLSHRDIHQALNDSLGDSGYVHDVHGDDKSGHVVFSRSGSIKRAPYKMRTSAGATKATIDHDSAEEVTPRTVYDPPITSDSKEAELVGDVISLKEGAVGQDGTVFLKLIAPGWGSSGHYSKEVLKRDGPKIFKAGTKNFWNHQTEAEEMARPEGDLRDLAGVLTEDATYRDDGPAGPGLYAKASVQPHFREHVDSLAKHIGMSIRASGSVKPGEAEGRKGPIVEKLTRGLSVDYVTTPGAGGKILQLFEAARSRPTTGENEMTKEEVQAMIREQQAPLVEENKRLRETVAMFTGPGVIREALSEMRLPDASKRRIVERLAGSVPVDANGNVDRKKLGELVEAEAKNEVVFLQDLGYDVGGFGTRMTEAEIKKLTETAGVDRAKNFSEALESVVDIFVGPKLEKGLADESARQARKRSRKAFTEGRAA